MKKLLALALLASACANAQLLPGGAFTQNGGGASVVMSGPRPTKAGQACISTSPIACTWQDLATDNTLTGSGVSGRFALWDSDSNLTSSASILFGANPLVSFKGNVASDGSTSTYCADQFAGGGGASLDGTCLATGDSTSAFFGKVVGASQVDIDSDWGEVLLDANGLYLNGRGSTGVNIDAGGAQIIARSNNRIFLQKTSGSASATVFFGNDAVTSPYVFSGNFGSGSNIDLDISGNGIVLIDPGTKLKVDAAFEVTSGHAATFDDLAGSGNAYACLDSAGKLYRSATPCM